MSPFFAGYITMNPPQAVSRTFCSKSSCSFRRVAGLVRPGAPVAEIAQVGERAG